MRPGVVFVGLFALLITVYALLASTLGTVLTFLLQAAIVLVLLAAAVWFRRFRTAQVWHAEEREPEAALTAQADTETADGIQKAS
jgi:L-lactate permease